MARKRSCNVKWGEAKISDFKATLGTTLLPKKQGVGRFLYFVSNVSVSALILWGIGLYVAIVAVFSAIGIGSLLLGFPLIKDDYGAAEWYEVIYFNFITILTVGYGDFAPVGIGRLLSVIEALAGVALFASMISIISIKSLSAPKNSLVFSNYAYYCKEDERFMIIFVNTTKQAFTNCEFSSYFKHQLDWEIAPTETAPFVTNAVQTFHIQFLPKTTLLKKGLRSGDCLRIGLKGNFGISTFSVAMQYNTEDILVIPNRKELEEYGGFENPIFGCREFLKMFNYHPPNAQTLVEYVETKKF